MAVCKCIYNWNCPPLVHRTVKVRRLRVSIAWTYLCLVLVIYLLLLRNCALALWCRSVRRDSLQNQPSCATVALIIHTSVFVLRFVRLVVESWAAPAFVVLRFFSLAGVPLEERLFAGVGVLDVGVYLVVRIRMLPCGSFEVFYLSRSWGIWARHWYAVCHDCSLNGQVKCGS